MNRVWLITGAGRGLGRAFAEEALKQGDKVIAAMRKPDVVSEWNQNRQVLCVRMDVTKKDEAEEAVRRAVEEFGKIDVLINNAGFGMSDAFEEVSDEELRTLMETNFFGVVNITKTVIPVMRYQGSGMILTIASQAGAMGFAGSSTYCASKFAVVGLSDALKQELAPFGIQVASVLPGAFRTDFRDGSSMKRARNNMIVYDNTPAHDARDYLLANNHKQDGDPAKAAEFLFDIVEGGKLPAQILIGEKCCTDVKKYYKDRIAEIDSYVEKASRTQYDA